MECSHWFIILSSLKRHSNLQFSMLWLLVPWFNFQVFRKRCSQSTTFSLLINKQVIFLFRCQNLINKSLDSFPGDVIKLHILSDQLYKTHILFTIWIEKKKLTKSSNFKLIIKFNFIYVASLIEIEISFMWVEKVK